MPTYRNVARALPAELHALLHEGSLRDSRNGLTHELLGRTITLTKPTERVQLLPHRNANLAAQIAETLWMLHGRDDIGWLSHYLPRAVDYSDDGFTWRGAYGPRLRDLGRGHIDQLAECAELIKKEPGTRRAVISLWDPARDLGINSKDIPCNNWLQFIERDGLLHLHVAVRSNDVWWGWSGIDTFSWSVLLEAMAYWTGLRTGSLTFFIGSFHLYKVHEARAKALMETLPGPGAYHTHFSSAPWVVPFEEFDALLEQVWDIESSFRERLDPVSLGSVLERIEKVPSLFLQSCLCAMAVYCQVKAGAPRVECQNLVFAIPAGDIRLGMLEWLSRQFKEKVA